MVTRCRSRRSRHPDKLDEFCFLLQEDHPLNERKTQHEPGGKRSSGEGPPSCSETGVEMFGSEHAEYECAMSVTLGM